MAPNKLKTPMQKHLGRSEILAGIFLLSPKVLD